MTPLVRIPFAAALLLGGASAASAQADSVLAVSRAGASLLRVNQDAGLVARGTAAAGSIPATGAGVRMMWYPGKWAFRAGQVVDVGPVPSGTYWNDESVGTGSAAFGLNTRASGPNSFAATLDASASGAQAVALGNSANASAAGAVALGSGAQATGHDALAMGTSSMAGGVASVAVGPSIANGNYGVAIGLQNSASGQFSLAMGKNARTAQRSGSVVIGDGCALFSSDSVYATANNQFVARGCGGIKFYTSRELTSGVEVAPGGGSWTSVSDRNRKENFRALDGEEVLARLRRVPVSTWNYLTQDRGIRHMGPMAQDFHAAFGLGESNLTITSSDIDGVNLAAAQALADRTDALRGEVAALRAENEALKRRQAELDARLARLEAAAKP